MVKEWQKIRAPTTILGPKTRFPEGPIGPKITITICPTILNPLYSKLLDEMGRDFLGVQ